MQRDSHGPQPGRRRALGPAFGTTAGLARARSPPERRAPSGQGDQCPVPSHEDGEGVALWEPPVPGLVLASLLPWVYPRSGLHPREMCRTQGSTGRKAEAPASPQGSPGQKLHVRGRGGRTHHGWRRARDRWVKGLRTLVLLMDAATLPSPPSRKKNPCFRESTFKSRKSRRALALGFCLGIWRRQLFAAEPSASESVPNQTPI